MKITTEAWLNALTNELQNNILGFWIKHTLDEEHGGFVGEIDNQLNVIAGAEKSLVLNARILWTFATAYRTYGSAEYLSMAERAYRYLLEHFLDKEYGGLYWMVDASGVPSQPKKQVYGQAFAIYALAEYHHATGDQNALKLAVEIFRVLEKHSYDPLYKGYIEALSREWEVTDELSLSDKDMNEKKSMNTHLHVLEGYTGLYQVWKSEELRVKLAELINTMLDHIVDDQDRHFHLFMDEEWHIKSDITSYGHDIEGSWLLVEAAEVLGDEALLERVRKVAVTMAEAVLAEGIDKDGGIWNEAVPSGLLNEEKDWWPQAEAMVGFYNAYQLTQDTRYLDASAAVWEFIDRYIVDHKLGEWYWAVDEHLQPLAHAPKVSAWKCPYHNSRACFEMIGRLQAAVKETH
ncbi:AGE family epimerase/isomerase [Paenibacillus sp. FSL R7-0331]|uniref:AGE family epimerase/isomerase n=1 Tax=Paenibacillus sp. FSL R7-0331 TaxID=1536773 RepID=UPI0004F63AE1|nr:AGE family epimerase/isomerase [Paenibacillus sp. FSL R7-0331]AIQ51626.1 N-acyl-D-glucosamine 2-epimerase [Paenibacillus sp. FSL R7-0331]